MVLSLILIVAICCVTYNYVATSPMPQHAPPDPFSEGAKWFEQMASSVNKEFKPSFQNQQDTPFQPQPDPATSLNQDPIIDAQQKSAPQVNQDINMMTPDLVWYYIIEPMFSTGPCPGTPFPPEGTFKDTSNPTTQDQQNPDVKPQAGTEAQGNPGFQTNQETVSQNQQSVDFQGQQNAQANFQGQHDPAFQGQQNQGFQNQQSVDLQGQQNAQANFQGQPNPGFQEQQNQGFQNQQNVGNQNPFTPQMNGLDNFFRSFWG